MKKIIVAISGGIVVVGVVVGIILSTGQKEETNMITRDFSYLSEAESVFADGDLKEALVLYKNAMVETEDVNELKMIQKQIEEINLSILFSPIMDECSQRYVVKPNDALAKIARTFKTTVGLIKRANHLTSDLIKPGQELKVVTCAFSIVVDKSQNVLSLTRNGETLKTYIVSTGTDNGTPTGNFKIINKLIDPTWYRTGAVIPPDSPENVLGSRWMGFDLRGYGVHGTTEPDQLGKQVTLGCVRMRNEEVEELFDIVPVGTEVTIVE